MALDGTYLLDVTDEEWEQAQRHGVVSFIPDVAGVFNRADVYVAGDPMMTFRFPPHAMRPGEKTHIAIRPAQNDEELAIRRWLLGGL